MHRHLQRHVQRHGLPHLVDDELLDRSRLRGWRFEQEFVVDLQHDICLRGCRPEAPVHAEHRQFDEVGGRALHDRVDRGPLGEREGKDARGTPPAGTVTDARDRPPSSEHRRHAAIAAAPIEHVVHEGLGAGERPEVGGDERGSLALRDTERLGQSKTALTVEDAEVHRLGRSPHRGGDRGRVDPKHRRRGARVDVFAGREGPPHRLVAGEMGQDAKLDLRIVCRDEPPAGLAGQEGGADLLPFGRAGGDVLQVGVAGAQPAGGRHRLVERRVNPACCRLHERRQTIDVGALQLGVLAVLQQQGGQRVHRREFFEHFGVGAGAGLRPLHHRQPQFVEEHGTHLKRRGDREGMPCEGVNLRLERSEPVGILDREGGQPRLVDPHAPVFHGGEHHRQRHFQLGEEPVEARLRQRRRETGRQFPPDPTGRDGLRGGGGPVDGSGLAVAVARRPDADIDAVADAHLREAEIPFPRVDQVGGEHRVERTARQFDAHSPQ